MAGSSSNTAFDDSEQLGDFLKDQRAADTKMVSASADALALIEAFRTSKAASPWISLDRGKIADRLADIITNPRVISQGKLNLCGPAAFFTQIAGRDPVSFTNCATALFDTGSAQIGELSIAPDTDLIATSYDDMKQKMLSNVAPQADWMLLGALRNTTNVFWQGTWQGDPAQELSALTRPEELAGWLKATGIYASVEDGGKWASNPGLPAAEDLKPYEGTDIALLIHLNMINISRGTQASKNILLNEFPNHWVVLLSEVLVNVMTDPDTREPVDQVAFRVWTWAGVEDIKVTKQVFIDNYFGAVTSKLA